MAYIHVKIDENSPTKVTLFRLDGWQSIRVNGEKYIEVTPGTHVVELYGPNTNYVFRGKLTENSVFEIVVMLGIESLMHDGNSFFAVVFEPEQYIRHLDVNEMNQIKEIVVAEQRQAEIKKAREDARGNATIQIIFAVFAFLLTLSFSVFAIHYFGTSEGPFLALGAIGLFVLGIFLVRKAIKNLRK